MSILILISVLFVVGARIQGRRGPRSPLLLVVALALPPFGLWLSGHLGGDAERTRVDVQFLGLRTSGSALLPCNSVPNPFGRRGVWIGGGRRWSDDGESDALALRGYRGHLIEVCRRASDGRVVVRAADPGKQFVLQVGRPKLVPIHDIDTQQVIIQQQAHLQREAFRVGDTIIPVSSIIGFATQQYEKQRRDAPSPTVRKWLLKKFGKRNDAEVSCVQIRNGAPGVCTSDLSGNPLFLWKNKSDGYEILPPVGAAWCNPDGSNAAPAGAAVALDVPRLSASATWPEWKSVAPVQIRMITRNTVGGVADQNVALDAKAFYPSPLRLGTKYELRVAGIGSDLLLLLEEPSVQLRMSDLFGSSSTQLKEGDFDITFAAPTGDELLAVDLSSAADHLSAKTALENLRARVSIPKDDGNTFLIRTEGRAAEKRFFNEVFALDLDPSSAVRPLLILRRVSAPTGTYVAPLFAALLLIVVLLAEYRAAGSVGGAWSLVALLFGLLHYRFAFATRWFVDEFSSSDALRVWLIDGAYLFVAPPVLFVIALVLRRQRPRAVSDDPFEETARSAKMFGWWRALLETVRGPRGRLTLSWLAAAVMCTAAWALLASPGWQEGRDVLQRVGGTLSVALLASAAANLSCHLASRFMTRSRQSVLSQRSGSSEWGVWLRRCLILGGVFVLLRGVTYLLGSQEQVLGIRVDTFSLPVSAGLLAGLTRIGADRRAQRTRLLGLLVIFVCCFALAGVGMNDYGLVWVGAMAFVLAIPIACNATRASLLASAAFFVLLFIAPLIAPKPFRELMRLVWDRKQVLGSGSQRLEFTDDLLVARSRDYYRLLDGNKREEVERIPSQLAREVAVERERVRYQSLDGAWRESFRSDPVSRAQSPWTGAGFLRARAVIGDPTFVGAARSDYVYPTYLRAEFGTLGTLAVLALYSALFFVAAWPSLSGVQERPLALWSSALAAGTGFFMLGGTARVFPFSGKWPLLLSFASMSDIALALALLALATVEGDL